jgi:hypothetical protein
VSLGKSKSGAYTARKVIPKDVHEEYQRLFGKRSKAGKIGKAHERGDHRSAKGSAPASPYAEPCASRLRSYATQEASSAVGDTSGAVVNESAAARHHVALSGP